MIECFGPILRAADSQPFRIDQIGPVGVVLSALVWRFAAGFIDWISMLTGVYLLCRCDVVFHVA